MIRSFENVGELAAFLESGEPFDLHTMRSAIKALVQRAVAADAKIHTLRTELEQLKAGAASTS